MSSDQMAHGNIALCSCEVSPCHSDAILEGISGLKSLKDVGNQICSNTSKLSNKYANTHGC